MKSILYLDGVTLPVTNLVTSNFLSIYTTLAESKLKLPARVLRFCAEQLYEIIASKEPSEKLALLDIDDIKGKDDIEFVVGIGVATTPLTERGYQTYTVKDIFQSLLENEVGLEPHKVLTQLIPQLDTRNNFLPVFRFLREANTTPSSCNSSVLRLASMDRERYKMVAYKRAATLVKEERDFDWITKNLSPEKAAAYIPFLADEDIPLDQLREFCQDNFDRAFSTTYSTFFRRLFCLYDFLKYSKEVDSDVSMVSI